MATSPTRPTGCSRRLLLQSAGGAIASLGIYAKTSAAQSQVSKQVVAYQDHPEGAKRCDQCVHFVPPAACKVVQGPISAEGYCRLFAARQQAGAGRMSQ
jgi:hypothetical protein